MCNHCRATKTAVVLLQHSCSSGSSQILQIKIFVLVYIIAILIPVILITKLFTKSFNFIWLLRYREVFSFTIAQLATSSKSSLKYWFSEFVMALTDAGVDEKFCAKLLYQYMEIGELLASVLYQYIKIQRPQLLWFNIPQHIACPAQLRLLLTEVGLHHKGKLRLDFHHSYLNYVPCDYLMAALAGARWDTILDILADIYLWPDIYEVLLMPCVAIYQTGESKFILDFLAYLF